MTPRKRTLALSDDILMRVEKPARYIGGEVNAVMKDPHEVEIRFAFCFPDVYEIGMSHLGIQILYDMLNSWEDVWCERVYSPWRDLDHIMRKEEIPLFALESQSGGRTVPLSSAAAPAPTIPSRWPIFSTSFTSVRERPSIGIY